MKTSGQSGVRKDMAVAMSFVVAFCLAYKPALMSVKISAEFCHILSIRSTSQE